MDYKITGMKMKDEFKICPACGYEDGFHSMFQRVKGVVKWLFVCLACHAGFDIGQTVRDSCDDK